MSIRLWPVAVYVVFGLCFGLLTYRHRHLFSEGPTRQDNGDAPGALESRFFWTLLCSGLWPVMVLTGLHSWWLLSSRRRAAQAQSEGDAATRDAPPRDPPPRDGPPR